MTPLWPLALSKLVPLFNHGGAQYNTYLSFNHVKTHYKAREDVQ